jgi:hypothetical protein
MDSTSTTAWATIVLAFVGLVSIPTNVFLAIAALRGVSANRETTRVSERQLNLLERQVSLQEMQAETARDAARPKLRCSLTNVGQLYIEGSVVYEHGTDPAEEIEIWVRGEPREGATWGLYRGWIGFMSPPDRQLPFRAGPASAQEQARLPFLDFLEGDLPPGERWVVVTWRRPDGTVDHYADRQHLDGVPPGRLDLKPARGGDANRVA